MSASNPAGQEERAAPGPRRRRLWGCLIVVAAIGLAGGGPLVWYYWPPANLALTGVLKAHGMHVLTVAFSPDGRQLASGGRDGKAKIWDLVAKTEPITVLTQNRPVTSLAFSPDGRTLAVAGGATGLITLCDPVSGTQSLAWKGDKEDDQPKVGWIPGVNGPVGYKPQYSPMVSCISYSPDGGLLVSCGHDVRIWNAETGKEMALCASATGIGWPHVAFSRDGRQLASSSFSGIVQLWDAQTGNERSVLKYQGQWGFKDVAFSPDGKTVVIPIFTFGFEGLELFHSGRIVVLDVTSGKLITDVAVGRTTRAETIVYSPDGKLVACAGETLGDRSITYLLDASSWHCVAQADVDGLSLSSALDFSPDGNQLVTGDSDGNLRFWDVSPYRSR